ncbi:hypothetical protein DWB85_08595 [Seongchinamella sediminis]|uniref:TonB C-terminal domain-containing protein n=1 Tax=Seongchinamella sediminis TaxID=2283635 RepID=A0A3L7DXM2_9GAMM|nr:hypothetical protein [Seongchinamella sediminis]RLQ22328.1 hypothetical protein DWB85_08595 [Seongchinamella sediminis]
MSGAQKILQFGCALLIASLGSHGARAAQAGAEADPAAPAAQEALLKDDGSDAYRREITRLESALGAYSGQLPEYLLSLGLSLQQSGQHQAAIDAFKRGIHLARINDGLYSAQQIPMLQREIASHMALGQYVEADQRQLYLYRVQMRSMDGGMNRARAFMQQAGWQHNAFRLALDGQGFARLMSMWDLYRLALNDIIDRQGETSSLLVEPLQGMLLAQYLIAGYDMEGINASLGSDNFSLQQQLNRFHAYRAQSYQKGRAVIQAIYDIEHANSNGTSRQTASSRVMLGDWLLWHGQREAAMKAYRQAVAELVDAGEAQQDIDARFAEPVALPDIAGARRLPETVAPEQANLQVQFDVNKQGKVLNLERVDSSDLASGRANRVLRTLRKTRFRPQLAMGEPLDTEGVTRAYEIEQAE